MALNEVADTARGGVRRGIAAATQQAELLASIASRISDLAAELLVDSPPEVLRRDAHNLRGAVLHGLAVLNELQHVSGQLESLAEIRDALGANLSTHSVQALRNSGVPSKSSR